MSIQHSSYSIFTCSLLLHFYRLIGFSLFGALKAKTDEIVDEAALMDVFRMCVVSHTYYYVN